MNNEAFERAKSAYGTGAYDDATMEFIFPELRESEDERIRKEIIEVLRFVPSSMWEQAKTNYKRCIAYLENPEKYGLQKPAEWSEEDKKNFEWFDKFFRAESVIAGGKDIPQDKYFWFKSLRPQPKQEWNEENDKDIAHIIRVLDDCYEYGKHDLSKTNYENLVGTLKLLCSKFHWNSSEEQEESEYYQHFDPDC